MPDRPKCRASAVMLLKWTIGGRQAVEYLALQRYLHWAVVLLCLLQVPTAWAIERTHSPLLPPTAVDLFLHRIHAWSGWIILTLALAQVALRYVHGVPFLSAHAPPIVRWGSKLGHTVLYGLLFALPVTGTGAMYVSSAFAPFHRLLSWTLLATVIVHVAAALCHHFIRHDDVLLRMTVGSRNENQQTVGHSGQQQPYSK